MNFSQMAVILPFWILGLPLLVGIIAFMRPRTVRGFVPPDRRTQRANLIGDPIIKAGNSVLFEG
jgi:hypothetical protein